MKAINYGISLRALGYLVALAEEAHFGRAAERCFVSQPTLSAQIKKLEEQLGVQLVERNQRRVMMTELGQEIAGRARAVLNDVEEIMAVARAHQDPLAGELRVGLIPTVGPYLLPRVTAGLKRDFPRMRLMLLEYQTDELLERLDEGTLDLAILADTVDASAYGCQVLYDEDFVVALPADHRLAGRRRLRIEDLDEETLLLLEEGHCLSDQALEVCSRIRVDQPQDFRATSLETLRQMVAAGVGVTLLPQLAANYGAGPEAALALRPFQQPRPGRRVIGLWRRSNPRRSTIGLVCDAITRTVGDAARSREERRPAVRR
jgi:LysR family hydrogen peroxide-inducible transcriptional activator